MTFTEQVTHWLTSISVSHYVIQDPESPFDLIEIRQSEKTALTIKLIDLRTWMSQHAHTAEASLGFTTKQKEIHQSGTAFITLWEDIWLAENNIVQSRLSAILGISQRIPARMTSVRRIDKPTADTFLNANHLQHAVSAKLKYGLYLPHRYFRVWNTENQPDTSLSEILVAVATFNHPRTFQKDGRPFRSYELIRFANLTHTTVVGGFDKLLRAFEKECKPDDIMTYADKEWSDGASYRRLGFEEISEREPIEFWLDPVSNRRYSTLQKTDDSDLIKIYNAGSRKFVKKTGNQQTII